MSRAPQLAADEESRIEALLDSVVEAATARRGDATAYEETLRRCVALLDLRGAVVVGSGGDVLARTCEDAAVVEMLERRTGQGPCTEALAEQRVVVAAEDELHDRWPRVAGELHHRGLVGVAGVPFDDEYAAGLFADHPLTDADAAVAQTLLMVASARVRLVRELWATTLIAEQLQDALRSRVIVEQAKGVLAERHRVPVEAAFGMLRGHARTRRQRLHDLAHSIVAGQADVPGPVAPATD